MRNLLKKPMFEKGNADWISQKPSVIQQYKNTVHNSTAITPINASNKVNEKIDFSNLQDKKEKLKPKI